MKKAAAVLLICTLISFSGSCAKKTDKEAVITAADTVAAVITENTSEADYENLLPENDYGGYEFLFMTAPDLSYADAMDYTEQAGEPVRDAVYIRNRIAEDRLNIAVSVFTVPDVAANAKKSVTAGDTSFDCCTLYFSEVCTQFIASDYFMDLNDIAALDLTRPWWDQNMHESLTINGNIITMVGEVLPPLGTVCVIFNKTLWNSLELNDPYDMVNGGSWTLDAMKVMAEGVTADLNGDSKLTQEDQWGIVSDNNFAHSFFFGSGERMVGADSEGTPVITFTGDRTAGIVDKIISVLTDESAVIRVDYIKGSYEYRNTMFMENRVLMSASSFSDVLGYRNMEADFGILPVPKFDEVQENYYCWGNLYFKTLAVPSTQPDPERTGVILETLAIVSKEKLTPAVYDILLEGKVTRDTESNDMITLINASRVYDIGIACNIGGFQTLLAGLASKNSADFMSAYAKAEVKAQAALDKIINYYAD